MIKIAICLAVGYLVGHIVGQFRAERYWLEVIADLKRDFKEFYGKGE